MIPGMGGRQGMAKKMAGKLLDSQAGDVLISLLVKQEQAIVGNVHDLRDELGLEAAETPDVDTRTEQVRAGLRALVAGIDEVPGVWMDHVGEHYLDDPDRARERFLDLDADEWGRECDKIVRSYRQQGIDSLSRSEIVEHYIGDRFGVSVYEFVTEVVNWSDERKQATVRSLVFGQFEGVEADLDELRRLAADGDLALVEEVDDE